jgi:hypothetical protein
MIEDKINIPCSKCGNTIKINIKQLKEDTKLGVISEVNVNVNKLKEEANQEIIKELERIKGEIKEIGTNTNYVHAVKKVIIIIDKSINNFKIKEVNEIK